MKKISLFALALAAGFAGMSQNQQDTDRAHKPLRTEMSVQPRFGLRGGASLSMLELDDDYSGTTYDMDNKTSFHLGAFVNIPLGGILRIQPEVSYFGGGSKVRGNLISNPLVTSGTGNYELDMHYIGVPIMFQLQTPSGFFVEAGPQGSVLIFGQEEATNGEKINLRERELVKQLDFGAAGGIGYLSRIGLGINARYYHGLSNVFNSDNAPAGQEDREISSRSLQLGLVYHFGAAK
jgi:hypothetical protein